MPLSIHIYIDMGTICEKTAKICTSALSSTSFCKMHLAKQADNFNSCDYRSRQVLSVSQPRARVTVSLFDLLSLLSLFSAPVVKVYRLTASSNV